MGKSFEKTIKESASTAKAGKAVQQTFSPAPINFLCSRSATNIYNNTVITVSSLNSKVAFEKRFSECEPTLNAFEASTDALECLY
jgi:hypothetical protein